MSTESLFQQDSGNNKSVEMWDWRLRQFWERIDMHGSEIVTTIIATLSFHRNQNIIMCLKSLNDYSWKKVTTTQTRSFENLQTSSDEDVTTIEFHRYPRLSFKKYLRTSVDVSAVLLFMSLIFPLSPHLLWTLSWQDPFPSSYYLSVLRLHPYCRHWHVTFDLSKTLSIIRLVSPSQQSIVLT